MGDDHEGPYAEFATKFENSLQILHKFRETSISMQNLHIHRAEICISRILFVSKCTDLQMW